MRRDRRRIPPAPGAGVPPGEGLLLSLSLAGLFAAADVCGDMTRQVVGRVSYACAAGDARLAARCKRCCLSPPALSPPERCWVGEKSRTSSGGSGVPAGLGGGRQGESCCYGTVGWLGLSHGADLGPFVKFPCA